MINNLFKRVCAAVLSVAMIAGQGLSVQTVLAEEIKDSRVQSQTESQAQEKVKAPSQESPKTTEETDSQPIASEEITSVPSQDASPEAPPQAPPEVDTSEDAPSVPPANNPGEVKTEAPPPAIAQEPASSEAASSEETSSVPEVKTEILTENSFRFKDGVPIETPSTYSEVKWPTDSRATAKIIDVGKNQGDIDWDLLAASGEIDYAIIRCGSGSNLATNTGDSKWKRNADACTRLGIPFGVYFYTYAQDAATASREADLAISLLRGYNPKLPVYFDLEQNELSKLPQKTLGDIAETFCNKISAAGYTAGIYANLNWMRNYLTDTRFNNWTKWIAQWNDECNYTGEYEAWQWTNQGRVSGINTNVDLSYWYGDRVELVPPDVSDPNKDVSFVAEPNADHSAVKVTLKNPPNAANISGMTFPTWTDKNGQDDLIWHKARVVDGAWAATIPISMHANETGSYSVHAYATLKDGKSLFVGGATGTIEAIKIGTIAYSNVDDINGKFTVTASNIKSPSAITNVAFPVWSDNAGQDDIHWYSGTKNADGSFSATIDSADHNYDVGVYNVHAYAADSRGVECGIKESTITVKSKTSQTNFTAKPNKTHDKIEVSLKDVRDKNVKNVAFTVWSDKDGQDDLFWHSTKKSGVNWSSSIPISQHENDIGTYFMEAYAELNNGNIVSLGKTTATIDGIKIGTIAYSNVDDVNGKFTVTASNIKSPSAITNVAFPVWSENAGQDDIHWYSATKNADGSFSARIDSADHNYDIGVYDVHAYAADSRGVECGIKESNITVKAENSEPVFTANPNSSQEKIDISLSNLRNKDIINVAFTVWSDVGGQNDLIWHSTKKSGGSWSSTIPLSSHNCDLGKYSIEAFAELKSGKVISLAKTATTADIVAITGGTITFSEPDDIDGKFTVTVSDLKSPAKIFNVAIPVWGEDGGQDDTHWYPTKKNADGSWSARVDSANQLYETGLYNVRVYAEDSRGMLCDVVGSTTTVKASNVAPVITANVNEDNSGIEISVANIRNKAVESVAFETWNVQNGTSTIKWHGARKTGGVWKTTIPISAHNYAAGEYIMNTYIYSPAGGTVSIGKNTAKVKGITFDNIEIKVTDASKGKFRVEISGLDSPAGITNVAVPVWSEVGGQDDLHWWYKASREGNLWVVNVSAENHNFDSGRYNAHVYATDGRGMTKVVGTAAADINPSMTRDVANRRAMVVNARNQLGQQGGEPYWRWYGFNYRIEWCACFVSWCANQTGVLNTAIPKSISCGVSINWFRNRDRYIRSTTYIPKSGDILFYDWGPDGEQDHVGIVESVNGDQYTVIEGNKDDECARRTVKAGYREIHGFGIPNY